MHAAGDYPIFNSRMGRSPKPCPEWIIFLGPISKRLTGNLSSHCLISPGLEWCWPTQETQKTYHVQFQETSHISVFLIHVYPSSAELSYYMQVLSFFSAWSFIELPCLAYRHTYFSSTSDSAKCWIAAAFSVDPCVNFYDFRV